jgi:hypothetical protein
MSQELEKKYAPALDNYGQSCFVRRVRQHNGQQLEDTKGVIRSRNAKDRQYNGQQLEDTKGVIRSRKAKEAVDHCVACPSLYGF